MQLKDALGKLSAQLATCIQHTEECFTDLEQAGAFTRINLEIKWSKSEDEDFYPTASSTALNEICGILPAPRHPAPRPARLPRFARRSELPEYAAAAKTHKHRHLRCSKCQIKGHVRRDCPDWQPAIWA
jgi:hypothetical protein